MNVDKKKTSTKQTEQAMDTSACACISVKDGQPPPPLKNTILSSEKLKVIEEKTSYFVTIELFADELIDYEGKQQQVYGVKRAKGEKYDSVFYFALPIKYNKNWNDLIIFSKADELWVGFMKKDKPVKLYKIYSYKYYNEKFGGGEIIVEAVLNKENYRVI